ncbi:MAG TPA: hypothetical protein VFZ69_00255 [Longimicrobiales bacterium]
MTQPEHTDGSASRPTPYSLIFGPDVFDEARFESVRAEDAGAAVSASQLFMSPSAGGLLREFTPPDGGPDRVAQVSALVFSVYRFWLHGRHVYRLTEPQARPLLAEKPGIAGPVVPPLTAGYVQLPRNLVWSRVSEELAPEPVDGFFWSAPGAAAASAARLDLLYALGVRAGRPGLSLFDVTLESVVRLEDWANADARAEGEDFANILPGGELQGYHAILTAAEALKLAALCFALIARAGSQWSVIRESGQIVHAAADG